MDEERIDIARRFLVASPPGEVGNVARGTDNVYICIGVCSYQCMCACMYQYVLVCTRYVCVCVGGG